MEALEIFAGASIVTRVLRATGLRTAALDLEYEQSFRARRQRQGKPIPKSRMFDLTTAAGFLTALMACLSCKENSHLVVIAIVCSSFVSISRGTTKRSLLRPLGDPAVRCVQIGNLLASRWGPSLFCSCSSVFRFFEPLSS